MLEEVEYIRQPGTNTIEQTTIELLPGTGRPPKRHFIKVDEVMFVHEIRKRPLLYDHSTPDSRKIGLRNQAWQEVAQAVCLSEQECKKRWRSMRDSFNKMLRNKNEDDQKTWVHYRLLEFMLPFIRKRRFVGGADHDQFDEASDDWDYDYIDYEKDVDKYRTETMTVYVTEDGKELFKVHNPDCGQLPESAEIQVDEPELDDIIVSDAEAAEVPSIIEYVADEVDGMLQNRQFHDEDFGTGSDVEDGSQTDEEQYLNEVMLQESPLRHETTEHLQSTWEDRHYQGEAPSNPAPFRCESTMEVSQCEVPSIPRKRVEVELEQSHVSDAPIPLVPRQIPTPVPMIPPQYAPPVQEMDARLGITDPDERFLLSCAPILKRLTVKKNRIARVQIQQLLYELEFDEKYCYDANGS